MAFQPYPNGYQAVIEYGQTALRWTNTLWFEDLNPETDNMQDLADFLFNWAATGIMPQLNNNWSLRKVTVYDMSTAIGKVVQTASAAVPGGVVGAAAAVSPALVVSFYSGARGRSGRGRNYITGFDEADVGPTEVSNPLRVTNIATTYDGLRSSVQLGPGYSWQVASRQSLGVVRPEIVGFDVLYSIVRSATLGSQRRRINRA